MTISITTNPGSIRPNATTDVLVIGSNTLWLTTPPLFEISGVNGASLVATTVIDDTNATITVTTGQEMGTATISETSSQTTTPLVVRTRMSNQVFSNLKKYHPANESILAGDDPMAMYVPRMMSGNTWKPS